MKSISLVLSIISCFIFIAGIFGFQPNFYNKGGLIVVLAMTILAVVLSFAPGSKYVITARVVSFFVMVALLSVLLKSYYLHHKVESIARQHSDNMRLQIEKSRLPQK